MRRSMTFVFMVWAAGAAVGQGRGAAGGQAEAGLLQQAQAALRANQQTRAAELFEAVLKIDPGNVESHANLGALDFYRGDCKAASGEFHAALAKAPTLTKAQALLAVCERRLGDAAAGADLEKAFAGLKDADPKMRAQIGIELADLYYQNGDLPRTAVVLRTLSDAAPDNVDILFFEQRVYSELADGTLNKLALLAPQSARMEQLIAERLINAGDLPHAMTHYRKALALNPKLPGMHFELAESLMESSPNNADAQKEALAELALAREVDGDSARVEDQLGRIALLQTNPAEAQAAYSRALTLSAGDPVAEIGLAEVMKQQNKPEDAARYLRLAIGTDPMNAEAHYKLAQVDRQLHLDAEQKEQLRLFLEIRATRDKIKVLYREMNPAAAVPAETAPAESAGDGAKP